MSDQKKREINKARTKTPMREQAPMDRILNFEEVPLGYNEIEATQEALRCIDCKNKPCVAGCPVGIDIPAFLKLVGEKNFEGALRKIKEKNFLPAICGRVCPQEDQCEMVCTLNKPEKGREPGGIGRVERFLGDYAMEHNLRITPEIAPSTGKTVAIIGSGPAGLTAALAVALTPLAVYGLQKSLGFWPDAAIYKDYHDFISWRWILMELATLAVGAILLWRYRLPFLIMPVAVTLWYMSMDLVPFLFCFEFTWELRRDFSLWFGLLMLMLAFGVDLRFGRRPDFAFWLYLFGMLAFWCGLSLRDSDSELAKFGYCLLNIMLLLLGTALRRRVFVVFGGCGLALYLGYLANEVFQDSLLFPVVLSFIGLGIIGLGILWQKYQEQLGQTLRQLLPQRLQQVIAAGD